MAKEGTQVLAFPSWRDRYARLEAKLAARQADWDRRWGDPVELLVRLRELVDVEQQERDSQ